MTSHPIDPARGRMRAVKISLLAGTAALGLLAAGPAQAETAREAALERRLQALEQELNALKAGQTPTQREAALEQRVVELENEIKGIKALGPERMVRGGRRDVTVELYGQANRGFLTVDDGHRTTFNNVDNDSSSTRFGMRGRAPILNNDITFGANIELEIQSNPSNVINQFDNKVGGNNGSTVTVDERILEAFVESKTFGRLSFGQGDTASNNTAEQDLSGTAVSSGYSDITTTAGGFRFANKRLANGTFPYSTNNALSPRIKDAFNNLDGLSRQDRLRYDTPSFYGFSAAGSVTGSTGTGATNARDAALFYSGKLGPVQLAAATAAAFQHNSFNIYDGSISALTDWGPNLTFAAGSTSNNGAGREPRQYYYVKLGYLADWFQIGKTAFAVDFSEQTDMGVNGDYAKMVGGYIVQNFDRQGTEVYLAVRNHSLSNDKSNPNNDFNDILAVMTGLRVRF
ncbi:MAG TPA: hypothetical protein VMV26_14685 [Alphaproteobacteria bacterium]|jgi:hypothetical protein|nr:hypothetical protein [Alphaproteobacteria bacterium]